MQMHSHVPPGSRVIVGTADMEEELGLGTYLGDTLEARGSQGIPTPTILLDSGKIVFGWEVWWAALDAEPAPPMTINVTQLTRLFASVGASLAQTGDTLSAGVVVAVEAISPKTYDHRPQVAARVRLGNETLYFLVIEAGVPRHYED